MATPVSLKCKICGGDLVNDYLAGACVCANCGNRWSLESLIPNYSKYTRTIEKINKAKELLDGKPDATTAMQAKLMYQTASSECVLYTDAIGSDLMRACKEGQERCEKVKTYAKAKDNFDRKAYKRAMEDFKTIPGFLDSNELIEQCQAQLVIERKKRIPLAIAISMVLPAILCIFLKEKVGVPILGLIPIFLVLSAGLAYAVYLERNLAVVIEILSFLCAVPLIIFLILAYGMHMDIKSAATIAIGAPIAVVVFIGVMVGKEKPNGSN